MEDAISHRPSVWSLTSLKRAWDTNKLGIDFVLRDMYQDVPMSARIKKGEMRRHIRIPHRQGLLHIASLLQFKR